MLTSLTSRSLRPHRATLATLLAGAVLLIGGLHYAPAVHEHIHDDAGHDNHHCVIEVFHEGILTGEITITVHAPAELITSTPQVAADFRAPATAWHTPPGRAPPLG